MAKIKTSNTIPIEEKLMSVFELQKVDSQMDAIHKLKGELPAEVSELENEIAALDTRLERMQAEVKELEGKVAKFNAQIAEAEALIVKYEKQQANVKNNREYDSLMQQIELQRLDIQLIQKRIRETKQISLGKEQTLEGTQKRKDGKLKDLDAKRDELKKIISKTEKDEKSLEKNRAKARKNIEERLLKLYDRIRAFYRDGLGVVTIERAACAGCHNQIPPQVQLDLRNRKKVVTCEHCGRILVDRGIAFPGEEIQLDENEQFGDYPDYTEDAWEE